MPSLVVLAVVYSVSFLIVTQGVVAAPHAALLGARAAGALAVGALAIGAPVWRRPGRWADAFVVGAVGVGAFAYLELAERSQWAPSGATALFMLATVPFWAAVIRVLRGGLESLDEVWPALLASVFVVLANAVILGNWERPSTFTPFSLFPRADVALLAAAAAWALGGVEADRRLHGEPPLVRAATAGLGAAWLLALAPQAVGELRSAPAVGSVAGYLGAVALIAGFALVLFYHDTVARAGAQAAAFACGAAPVLLSAWAVVERAIGTQRGPVPLIGSAVASGVVLALAAALAGAVAGGTAVGGAASTSFACSARAARRPGSLPAEFAALAAELGAGAPRRRRAALRGVAWVFGALALAAALVGFLLPSVAVAIESHLGSQPFAASWSTPGYATVGAWLALAAAAAGVAAPTRGPQAWLWALVIAASQAAVLVGGYTLWSAWFSWVPVDVQQALGSPYALMTEKALLNPGAAAAPALALGAWLARRLSVV